MTAERRISPPPLWILYVTVALCYSPPSVRSLITMRNVIEHFSRILQNKIGIGLFLPRIPRELALGDVINNTVASRRAESTGSSAWSMAIA